MRGRRRRAGVGAIAGGATPAALAQREAQGLPPFTSDPPGKGGHAIQRATKSLGSPALHRSPAGPHGLALPGKLAMGRGRAPGWWLAGRAHAKARRGATSRDLGPTAHTTERRARWAGRGLSPCTVASQHRQADIACGATPPPRAAGRLGRFPQLAGAAGAPSTWCAGWWGTAYGWTELAGAAGAPSTWWWSSLASPPARGRGWSRVSRRGLVVGGSPGSRARP